MSLQNARLRKHIPIDPVWTNPLHVSLPNNESQHYVDGTVESAMSKQGQHVVPSERGWSVRKAGSTRASSNHATQQEAIAAATTLARNQRTELYIHGRDGRIRERNSYGKDPHPPKR
ncbi:DUF2188 domain-containing protein [Blastomonas fulva]|uniref:DUF2188 domain-containing protein n=1 Tax=Blastomonas fulva TaxID=1550728 RepID=UPI003F6F7AE4